MSKKLAPDWTPSSKDFMYSEGQRSGQRVVARTPDGKEVSVPHLPYEWWIDTAGNVCPLPVSTNRLPKQFAHQYAQAIRSDKAERGWIKYDSLPEDQREAEIARRKAAAKQESAQFDKISTDKLVEMAKLQGQALENAIGKLVDKVAKR